MNKPLGDNYSQVVICFICANWVTALSITVNVVISFCLTVFFPRCSYAYQCIGHPWAHVACRISCVIRLQHMLNSLTYVLHPTIIMSSMHGQFLYQNPENVHMTANLTLPHCCSNQIQGTLTISDPRSPSQYSWAVHFHVILLYIFISCRIYQLLCNLKHPSNSVRILQSASLHTCLFRSVQCSCMTAICRMRCHVLN